MIVLLYFLFIFVSLFLSLRKAIKLFRENHTMLKCILKSSVYSLGILIMASVWWFFTEEDGISQGIGIMIYMGAFLVITILNTIILYVLKENKNEKWS